MSFFDYINSRHPNIKFTFEKENYGKLSFLDILVDNSSRDCVFSVFHKKTYTGLLTNVFSFTPSCYKIGLIRTIIIMLRKQGVLTSNDGAIYFFNFSGHRGKRRNGTTHGIQ